MARKINFWELPVEDAQPDDTVPAYRGRGQVVRVRLPDGGSGDAVTSVGVAMPTGFEVANSPITTSGTITITFADGYGLPATAAMSDWSTAFEWGDHAQAGYALASSVASALATKVDKVAGMGLSTEDYTTVEKGKLANIQAGATANQSDAYLLNRANHTGTQGMGTVDGLVSALAGKVGVDDVRLSDAREWSASTVTQSTAEGGTSTVRFAWTAQRVWQAIAAWWAGSAAKSKLDGIQAGATANATDAQLRDRSTHTGTQSIGTIANLQSTLDTKVNTSDVRLSDAREWTASTVTQATAEGGTSTVRFAWTAQRVRQAIVAWWATITLTKSDVGLGSVDNTPDNQKTVHSFLVSDTRAVVSVPNAVPARSGLFEFKLNTSVGSPPSPSTGTYSHVLTVNGWTADGTGGWPTQISFGNELAFRKAASALTWGAWRTLIHSATYSLVEQAEAEAGSGETVRWWNALRVRQNVAAFTYDKPTIVAMVTDDANKNFTWIATTAELTANAANKVSFASPRTLTLPGTPAENEYVIILRTAGSMLGSVIARNGRTIMGVAENMTIDSNLAYLRLDYVDGSWRISS